MGPDELLDRAGRLRVHDIIISDAGDGGAHMPLAAATDGARA